MQKIVIQKEPCQSILGEKQPVGNAQKKKSYVHRAANPTKEWSSAKLE